MNYLLYVRTVEARDGEHELSPPEGYNVLAHYVGQHEGRVLVGLLLVRPSASAEEWVDFDLDDDEEHDNEY